MLTHFFPQCCRPEAFKLDGQSCLLNEHRPHDEEHWSSSYGDVENICQYNKASPSHRESNHQTYLLFLNWQAAAADKKQLPNMEYFIHARNLDSLVRAEHAVGSAIAEWT